MVVGSFGAKARLPVWRNLHGPVRLPIFLADRNIKQRLDDAGGRLRACSRPRGDVWAASQFFLGTVWHAGSVQRRIARLSTRLSLGGRTFAADCYWPAAAYGKFMADCIVYCGNGGGDYGFCVLRN